MKTYPDWGKSSGALSSPDIDLTEVTSRISKMSPLRRDGRLVYYDDFETGVNGWEIFYGEAFQTIERSYMGQSSLRINASIGLPYYRTSISKRFPYITSSPFGLELTFSAVAESRDLGISLTCQNETEIISGKLSINAQTGNLALMDSDYSMIPIANVPVYDLSGKESLSPVWHNLKMVVDFTNREYLRVYYDEYLTRNISPVLNVSPYTNNQYIQVTLSVTDDIDRAGGPFYFDNLLLTTDEHKG